MHRLTVFRLHMLLATALLLATGAVQAATYSVEHDATADTLQLRDVDSGALVATSATGCCDVVAGGLDTDTSGNRLFVLDSTATGQHLVTLSLPGLGAIHDVALAAGMQYTGPRFNPTDGLLYALEADPASGKLGLVTLNPATGASTAVGSAKNNCCMIAPGTLALGADNARLMAVTRALDDATLALSSWNLGSGVRSSYAIAAGRHIDALARDIADGNWLMLYRDDGGDQTLARLTLPSTVTSLATLADCCSTLASTATFDPAGNRLRVVARGDTSGTLRSYVFGTGGTVQAGAVLGSSLGLVRSASMSDVIFADGFEVVPTLTGGSAQSILGIGTPSQQLRALASVLTGKLPDASITATAGDFTVEPDDARSSHPPAEASTAASTLAGPAIPVPALQWLTLILLMLGMLAIGLYQYRVQSKSR